MIFSYGQEVQDYLSIISMVLKEYNLNLYEDVIGWRWEFSYTRNRWRGLKLDEEGKALQLQIKGFAHSEEDTLREEGWEFKKVKNVCKLDEGHYIGLFDSSVLSHLNRFQKCTDESLFYLNYSTEQEEVSIVHAGQMIKLNSNFSQRKFSLLVSQVYPPPALYQIVNKQKKCPERIDLGHFCAKMMSGQLEITEDHFHGTGFAGMELLLEDLSLFAEHGHLEWMKGWYEFCWRCFDIISKQRKGNYQYFSNKFIEDIDLSVGKSLKKCYDLWTQLPDKDNSNLPLLANWFKQVIEKEKEFFRELQGWVERRCMYNE